MVKDLSVRVPVSPADMEEPVQAIEVKLVEFLDMSAVHIPCLTGIQKGWENNSLVHFELCVCVCAERPFIFPDIFAWSAECSTCFGKSITYYLFNK